MVKVVEWSDSISWNRFVLKAGDATVMHLYAWKAVIERSYGHKTYYLAAVEDGKIVGVLPLVLIRSRFLGGQLVSMPFMDYGGACVGGRSDVETALVARARQLAEQHHAGLVLRYAREVSLDMPCSLEKMTMFFTLGTNEGEVWKRLPPERRNRIRKGQKEGLTVSFHGAAGLDNFYSVFAANMRDLGSPVHSFRFFKEVMAGLGCRTKIILVHHQGRSIGAGLMLLFGGTISIPWVSSLRSHFDKSPNQVLYWEAMRFGLKNDYQILDLGRSSQGTGGFEAKRQWGAVPVQLYWHYYPSNGKAPGDDVKRLGWATHVWRRLPMPVANTVGPWLRKGISN